MKIFKLVVLFIILFFCACSSKEDILSNVLKKQSITLSSFDKKNLERVYKENYKFWNKYPAQVDMFIKNNFTKKARIFRTSFINKNIQDIKKSLSYEELYIEKKKNYSLYNFIRAMEEFSFIVEDDIVKDVYVYDLI